MITTKLYLIRNANCIIYANYTDDKMKNSEKYFLGEGVAWRGEPQAS